MYKKLNTLAAIVTGGAISLAAPFALAAETTVTPGQVVSAMEKTFGVHPGQRRNHIKGTCALGTFAGLPAAWAYSRSAIFSGEPIPVVARFSLAGGNPDAPDAAPTPRGLALELRAKDGEVQHFTMLDTPMFGAATPQTFFDDLVSKQPDPTTGKPDPAKIKAFRASHPDALAQIKYLATHNPPPSWANTTYFGIHTFKFVNSDNVVTLVRWRFVPEDGDKQMSAAELQAAPANFLQQRLIDRVKKGPVVWDMMLTIGKPGDPETNPTLAWPAKRKEVKIGTLTITQAMPQQGAACEKINYDPLVMSQGIQATADPVLQFRSPAYAVSFGKRVGGQ
jgi:catalase